MPSEVFSESIAEAGQLVLEARSTHPDFPADMSHFTSVRLMDEEGGLAFLDLVLGGGRTPVVRLDTSARELEETIRDADPALPLPVSTRQASCVLIPFKDVPKIERSGVAAGQMIPLAPRDFAVQLPGVRRG